MEAEPIILSLSDAKELFSDGSIAANPYLFLANAKLDDVTIPACMDFSMVLSSAMENAGDGKPIKVS